MNIETRLTYYHHFGLHGGHIFFCIVLGASLLYYLIRTYHEMLTNKKEKEIYEAKIEFFTNIAHEIKTPLTLLKGPVENLSEMVNEMPAIKKMLTSWSAIQTGW
jgi:signal transduction histidine kinase